LVFGIRVNTMNNAFAGAWCAVTGGGRPAGTEPRQRVWLDPSAPASAHGAAGRDVRIAVERADGSVLAEKTVTLPDRWDSASGDFVVEIDVP
jgi:hypothetical protein